MASTEALDVVPIDADHCEAVWPLSIEAGWNQNVADWRFMLGAGRGFGCTGPDGKWQASSLVLPLGQKLAWISMVLVTKERRRGGLGTGLLKRCIDEVRSAGAVAGLDATEQGRPIYLPLGFRDLYRISRWHFDQREGCGRPPACRRQPASGRAGRPAQARALRPAADRHGAAGDPRASRAAPARPCLDRRGRGGKDRGLRAGPRGTDGDLARPRGGRQRGDRAGADRQGGRVGARTLHHRRAGGPSRASRPGWRRRARPRRAVTCA